MKDLTELLSLYSRCATWPLSMPGASRQFVDMNQLRVGVADRLLAAVPLDIRAELALLGRPRPGDNIEYFVAYFRAVESATLALIRDRDRVLVPASESFTADINGGIVSTLGRIRGDCHKLPRLLSTAIVVLSHVGIPVVNPGYQSRIDGDVPRDWTV